MAYLGLRMLHADYYGLLVGLQALLALKLRVVLLSFGVTVCLRVTVLFQSATYGRPVTCGSPLRDRSNSIPECSLPELLTYRGRALR